MPPRAPPITGAPPARERQPPVVEDQKLDTAEALEEDCIPSIAAADGAVEAVARIVAQIRRRWPHVRILVRADSGFARDDLMAWCEDNGVHFLFGLAQNKRLVAMITDELAQAEAKSRRTGKPARYFKEFRWLTRKSWSRERRVIAKAEFTKDEANPRFVVTSLTRDGQQRLTALQASIQNPFAGFREWGCE
jgi:hypothetical protein